MFVTVFIHHFPRMRRLYRHPATTFLLKMNFPKRQMHHRQWLWIMMKTFCLYNHHRRLLMKKNWNMKLQKNLILKVFQTFSTNFTSFSVKIKLNFIMKIKAISNYAEHLLGNFTQIFFWRLWKIILLSIVSHKSIPF